MKQLKKTTAINAALENEVREYLRLGDEIRQDYLIKILEILEPGTYITFTNVVEVSKGLTAVNSLWIKEGVEYDWYDKVKSRNTVKVSIDRKGRNSLSFSRDNRRFKVTGM